MIRNLKALGLALVAVFALSALAASVSSADTFTSATSTTILTGETDGASETIIKSQPEGGANLKCKHASYAGTQSGTAVTSVRVHPKYSECEIEGIGAATFDTQGCDYLLTGTTTNEDATTKIECTTGSEILMTSSLCVLHFGSQEPLGGVHYTNLATSPTTVTVTTTVTGVHFTKTAGPGGNFCFLVPGGTEGVFSDKTIVKGYVDTASSQNSTTHEWTFTEGNQVNISVDSP